MQVILLEAISRTGKLGDIVNVKAGFARNYLIPQSKAQMATKANIEAFEHIKAELETNEANSKEKAERVWEQLNGSNITITANASEEGKLYGSISVANIVEALNDKDFEIEKRNINLDFTIRNVGEYEVSIDLWTGILAKITLTVEATESQN